MIKLGLIGYPLVHSFSQKYFEEKFIRENKADFCYDLIPAPDLDQIIKVLRMEYFGLNVTIPYKVLIAQFINEIDLHAWNIGAINTLVRTGRYSWKGYNTDYTGFSDSLRNWFGNEPFPAKALILGTGGSSRAVAYALQQLGIRYQRVSGSAAGELSYEEVNDDILQDHLLIINTTPLGMHPQPDAAPPLPYTLLTKRHYLFDLVYNPANTLFLSRGEQAGAKTRNGLDMLHRQADHAWGIWKQYGKF
jgi:shikimate dehydrogenase